MHRIDVPSATVDDKFTEGSPTGGIPATVVSADWLNDLQENVVAVILGAGIPLTKGRADDLKDAIAASALLYLGQGGTSASDWVSLPYRDKTTGVKRLLIVQWGTVTASGPTTPTAVTFPIPFPSACRALAFASFSGSPQTPASDSRAGYQSLTASGFGFYSNASSSYIAVGV